MSDTAHSFFSLLQKKKGPEGKWFPFIKELDRLGGRGPQGAKSPLLWEEGQAESLLAGSPVIGQIKERIKGIRKESEELDTVWYMSGSLFSNHSGYLLSNLQWRDLFKHLRQYNPVWYIFKGSHSANDLLWFL